MNRVRWAIWSSVPAVALGMILLGVEQPLRAMATRKYKMELADDLNSQVARILRERWTACSGRVVPEPHEWAISELLRARAEDDKVAVMG